MSKPDNKPISFCGDCGKHYPITTRECPTCDKTLVVWRPASEPEHQARRWWQLINFRSGLKPT